MRITVLLTAALLFVATVALADDPPESIPGLPTPIPSPSPDPDGPEAAARRARRIAATRHLAVLIPKKTPFDADRAARRVYLKAYRTAYRFAAAGIVFDNIELTNTPHLEALLAGHSDGERAAVKRGFWIRTIIDGSTPK